jgi:drug/metabolite transporter (DMT)-like permease
VRRRSHARCAPQVVGLVAIAAGFANLGWPAQGAWGREWRGIGLALLTGVAIVGYSVTDGLGPRHDPSVLGYASALFLLQGGTLAIALPLARRDLPRRFRDGGG